MNLPVLPMIRSMGGLKKTSIVLAGYAAAAGVTAVAVWLYDLRLAALPYDTSGGMFAFGELLFGVGVFLVLALAPTLAALWFLRSHARFWTGIALLSLAFAVVGLFAVLVVPMVIQGRTGDVRWVLLELVALAHWLGVPLWLLAFAFFAFLAPTATARRLLVAAIGVETVVAVCAFAHWFLHYPRPR